MVESNYFPGVGFTPVANKFAGLLASQVGYEPAHKVKFVLRNAGTKKETLSIQAISHTDTAKFECTYWGEQWGDDWWVAELPAHSLNDSTYIVSVFSGKKMLFTLSGVVIQESVLASETLIWSSVDLLERRSHFTGLGKGWMDAGVLWVELPTQCAALLGLAELYQEKELSVGFQSRILDQMVLGAEYLLECQSQAEKYGHPAGSFSHDAIKNQEACIPNDATKAILSLLRVSQVLKGENKPESSRYFKAAELSLKWLDMHPNYPAVGFNRLQRNLPEDYQLPKGEWSTLDLAFLTSAYLDYWRMTNANSALEKVLNCAKKLCNRQLKDEDVEGEIYGMLKEFDSSEHMLPLWTHSILDNQFGIDCGGCFPNFVEPILELAKEFPDHKDVALWTDTLRNYADGFLKVVTKMNPFDIVPVSVSNDEPVWFAGPFHGTNAIYGYSASLCYKLAIYFEDDELAEIANANLQWIAGLNAGLTKENLKEAVVFHTDIDEGLAVPVSMICGVGQFQAGSWFHTRGVICNGFSAGKQFHHDKAPIKENDAPSAFTDEDWIAHAAAWVSGLIGLHQWKKHKQNKK